MESLTPRLLITNMILWTLYALAFGLTIVGIFYGVTVNMLSVNIQLITIQGIYVLAAYPFSAIMFGLFSIFLLHSYKLWAIPFSILNYCIFDTHIIQVGLMSSLLHNRLFIMSLTMFGWPISLVELMIIAILVPILIWRHKIGIAHKKLMLYSLIHITIILVAYAEYPLQMMNFMGIEAYWIIACIAFTISILK